MINWLANPVRFLKFAKYASPVCAAMAVITITAGIWFGLFNSPPERYQGDSVRIMYVHVPSVWLAMLGYMTIAIASFVSYIWRHPLADIGARACALPGAAFTALGLATGSLWGSQTWMTWWQWDGRMTSFLVLLFVYLGYMSIWSIMSDQKRAARIAGIVAMLGAINIPIIKFSVDWWDDTLHQKSTLSSPGSPGLPPEMLTPLLLMVVGFTALFAWIVINNVRTELARQRNIAQQNRQHGQSAASVTIETL